ncbi:MAG: STM4011 family radical SAM protein [Pseudomonadota bacterium]|nr:STM4011 family radical SAM protein [Pseudomonadota bacterium]
MSEAALPTELRPLGILWRGPLDSCNYGCGYCPFAKRSSRRAMLDADRVALARFVAWVEGAAEWSLEVLFTPYGEALVWPWYRDALARISHLPHVRRVAIQTNGSAPMGFLAEADRARLALWVSWHPSEVPREAFAAKMAALHREGTRLSVGAVALPENVEAVEALRAELPPGTPMWINAQKPGVRYGPADIERWSRIDPGFALDVRPHATRGKPCDTGDTVISVDGAGTIHRCHFVADVLGNLYDDDLAAILGPRPCPRPRCDCYIGYAHLPALGMRAVYGDDLLARMRPSATPRSA